MSKQRQTFSLDEHVAEYLRQPHINGSGLVNQLVLKYMRDDVDV
jgi:hypothetical protein